MGRDQMGVENLVYDNHSMLFLCRLGICYVYSAFFLTICVCIVGESRLSSSFHTMSRDGKRSWMHTVTPHTQSLRITAPCRSFKVVPEEDIYHDQR